MQFFKRLLDFYINSSIHVALSVYALVRMTGYMFGIDGILPSSLFAFFGTIVAYNFVKYDALARRHKLQVRTELKLIAVLSFLSFWLPDISFSNWHKLPKSLLLRFWY
ncbi:MAG: hypothetical protein M0D53_10455 [Flavobacterium sp. JAD_PAG50586_2]|nr:MAG: hypothetical protein M0D53_10455 [Flavobacterium sp. JAD_PAG50586_2]